MLGAPGVAAVVGAAAGEVGPRGCCCSGQRKVLVEVEVEVEVEVGLGLGPGLESGLAEVCVLFGGSVCVCGLLC